MATAKIVTWSRPNKDGQFPIGIKISTAGKPSSIFEGHTVPSRSSWDEKRQEVKKSVPHAARLTNLLFKRLAEIKEEVLKAETDRLKLTAQSIKIAVKGEDEPVEEKPVLFTDIANRYLQEQLDSENVDIYSTDRSRLKRFYEFSKGGNLTFPEIHSEFLRQYVVFLKKEKRRSGNAKTPPKPLSERTIMNHLLIIRTLWNRAITAKVVSQECYPFGVGNKLSIKFPESAKIGLDFDELTELENIDLSDKPKLHHARNVCLLSYYFAGMRLTDALLIKWSDFQSGRFHYTMSKNGEPGSLKVPDKVQAIIEEYRHNPPKNDLIFPDLKCLDSLEERAKLRDAVNLAENRINKAIKVVARLIGTTKSVSPHKFRHAFAQRAEEKNVHPKVLQKLYRHESILTTMKYQSNFSHQKADEALDAVIGF
jgi:integrase/recombinase XerD